MRIFVGLTGCVENVAACANVLTVDNFGHCLFTYVYIVDKVITTLIKQLNFVFQFT